MAVAVLELRSLRRNMKRNTGGCPMYSETVKEKAVQDYLNKKGSMKAICKKYNIKSDHALRRWIDLYNKNSNNKPRNASVVSEDERIRIAKECLGANKDYNKISKKHNISYQQCRTWTLKYEKDVKDHKEAPPPAEPNLDKLEIERLKKKLRIAEMERDLLLSAANLINFIETPISALNKKGRSLEEKLKEAEALEPIARKLYEKDHAKGMSFRRFFAESVLNESESSFQRLRTLKNLSEKARMALSDGKISETAAAKLATLSQKDQDEYVANFYPENTLERELKSLGSVKHVEEFVQKGKTDNATEPNVSRVTSKRRSYPSTSIRKHHGSLEDLLKHVQNDQSEQSPPSSGDFWENWTKNNIQGSDTFKKHYATAEDIQKILGCDSASASKLLNEMNKELKLAGKFIIYGKIPWAYLREKLPIDIKIPQ